MAQSPGAALPDGFEIVIEPRKVVHPEGGNGALVLSENQFYDGSLLCIFVADPSGSYVQGTGFLVYPGIAITAKHVIEEFQLHRHYGTEHGPVTYALSVADDQVQIWVVKAATMVDRGDYAVLSMALWSACPHGYRFRVLTPSAHVPLAGERVLLAGIRPTRDDGLFSKDETIDVASVFAAGLVTDVWPNGRGFLDPEPCFQADVLALGSMSGGPVFNEAGYVVGLISKSVKISDGDYSTKVSLIGPPLFADLAPPWPPHFYQPGFRLIETQFVEDAEKLWVEDGICRYRE